MSDKKREDQFIVWLFRKMCVNEFVCLYVCALQASDVIVNDVLRCAYTSVSFIRFAHSSQFSSTAFGLN